jgi:choline dehydrogenase-like flavoprotein
VFIERRYKPDERWLDGTGRSFTPGVHYVVGGNTKVYGASVPRLRERDFAPVEHREGVSPAWPFTYAELEPYYAEAERMYRVHGNAEGDPTGPWRSAPFPYPPLEHEPYVADLAARLREQGVSPTSNAMGVDMRPGGLASGALHVMASRARSEPRATRKPAASTPPSRPGMRGCRTACTSAASSPMAPGAVCTMLAAGPDGPVEVMGGRFVLAAGAVNSAALLLASADDAHPRGLANSSDQVDRNLMMHNNAHIVAIDMNRRNDVVFQKTLSVNDWKVDGGDGFPLGTMQLIGKVQGTMMKSVAPRAVPLAAVDQIASRSVEWLIMAEDLPAPGESSHG